MNRNIIIITVLSVLLISVASGILIKKKLREGNEITSSWTVIKPNIEQEEVVVEKSSDYKKQKLSDLRKKLALKWLILKWDTYLEEKEYTSALVKYLQILKQVPNDENTLKKLWDIYYNLKKFKQAYSYYSKIPEYVKVDKTMAIKSLLISSNLSKGSISSLKSEIDLFWLNDEEFFYYSNSILCASDFKSCEQNFEKYFSEKTDIKLEELKNIANAIQTYNDFNIEDYSYKQALILWAFFENKLYPISIAVWEMILKTKADYKPVLKIVAKSYYEIWDYSKSKENLSAYNKLVKKDSEASYFLGVVYEKLHEYVLSTIHLKKALKTWYENTLDINKRILFNYYELGEIEKMLDTLKIIMSEDEEKLNNNDYNLAIYYHIINWKTDEAKVFIEKAIKKYPEDEIFNWYMWWVLLEEINKTPFEEWELSDQNYKEAEKYIDNWLEINSKSPMLNLVKWKIELSKRNADKAFIYLKKTISLDKNGDFWKIAKTELEKITIKNKKDE